MITPNGNTALVADTTDNIEAVLATAKGKQLGLAVALALGDLLDDIATHPGSFLTVGLNRPRTAYLFTFTTASGTKSYASDADGLTAIIDWIRNQVGGKAADTLPGDK